MRCRVGKAFGNHLLHPDKLSAVELEFVKGLLARNPAYRWNLRHLLGEHSICEYIRKGPCLPKVWRV